MRRPFSFSQLIRQHKKVLILIALALAFGIFHQFDGGFREELSLFTKALKAPFVSPPKQNALLEQLKLENTLLNNQLSSLKCLLQEKNRLLHISDTSANSLYKPTSEIAIAQILIKDLKPSSFTFWVDIGSNTCQFIGKGSPVCFGPYALGIIDYVGKRTSRVRLIADPKLQPSVTAIRGQAARSWMTDILDAFKADEKLQKNTSQRAIQLIQNELQSGALSEELENGYLTGQKRHAGQELLRGEGFSKESSLQVGDRLITSGLDGMFPKGLIIGKIIEMTPPPPGALSYGVWIKPIYTKKRPPYVYILPPMETFIEESAN
jgi:rod shape-determining protein MreC